MRGWKSTAFGVVLWCLSALPASGLSLLVSGPTTGPLAPGAVGVETPTAGQSITFRIALDQSVSLAGYDLLLTWDPTELGLGSVTDLTGLGLDVLPGSSGVSERVAAIELTAVVATDLLDVQFDVLAVVADGSADFGLVTNGAGLAPASLVLSSATGATVHVPEPRGLVPTSLVGLLLLLRLPSRRHPRELAP